MKAKANAKKLQQQQQQKEESKKNDGRIFLHLGHRVKMEFRTFHLARGIKRTRNVKYVFYFTYTPCVQRNKHEKKSTVRWKEENEK